MLINANLSNDIPFKNEVFHCVITSIPYYGQRAYDVPPQIWGGIPHCKHEWEYSVRKGVSGGVNMEMRNIKGKENYSIVPDTENATCTKCGAWYGFLGLEPTYQMFIDHNVQLFREVRRVMRSDAVLYLNVGDTYVGTGGSGSQQIDDYNLPMLNKMGIPFRLLFALVDDGWIWRQDIIWAKGVSFNKGDQFDQEFAGSPMPESVQSWRWERHKIKVSKAKITYGQGNRYTDEACRRKMTGEDRQPIYEYCPGCPKCEPNDGYILRKGSWRPTTSHEYIFMLTKTDSYYCDKDAVTEPLKTSLKAGTFGGGKYEEMDNNKYPGKDYDGTRLSGRNLRSVWTITSQGYKGEHYAAFGPMLIEPMIKASCPEKVCPECGAPFARVIDKFTLERFELDEDDPNYAPVRYPSKYQKLKGEGIGRRYREIVNQGFKPTCEHDLDPIPGIVYDPFMGSGTVGIVANYLGRRWVGTDLGWSYLMQAKDRTLMSESLEVMKEIDKWVNGIVDRQSDISSLPMFSALKE